MKLCFRKTLQAWRLIPVLLGLASAPLAYSQTIWNNSGADWATAGNWTAGVPTGSTLASFSPQSGGLSLINLNPSITGSEAAQGLLLSNSYFGGGYTLSGGGTLTVGSQNVVVRGIGSHRINNITLAGAASGNLIFNVGRSSVLTLGGTTTALTNAGNHTIMGGKLVLDHTASTADKFASTSNLTVNGGGVLEIIGNGTTTNLTFGGLTRTDNAFGGVNTILVDPNGANTVATFANTGTFTLRAGTRNVLRFEAASGALGDTGGAQIKFVGTPFVTTSASGGSLLSNTATGATVGWAIVSDSYGINFATYNGTGTSGRGIISIANPDAGITITTLSDTLTGAVSTNNTQLNVSASTTVTASAALSVPTLRISPGVGSTLAMGANNLNASAIMLDGANDFAITGTGAVGTGTRYIYVNNPATTLSIQGQITNSTNPVVFAGPGFVALTGSVLQNEGTAGNNYRITIADGVLRANNTQLGFDTTRGVINLYGGVLEITSGTNGTGTSADFRRALGTSAGNVNWGAGNADQGSGGFSAFGAAASVNIGGAASPAALQWNQASFVADGNALMFGSTKSNAVLNWLNPLQLDNGSGYQAREINVTAGVGGDKTVLQGVVSGAANADLFKTGTGTLELTQANTYQGNTLVNQGTLLVTNSTGSATGSGQVFVGSAGTLGGTGIIEGNTVILGTHSPGLSPGIITHESDLTYLTGAIVNWELISNSSSFGPPTIGIRGTDFDGINVGGALDFSGSTTLNLFFNTSGGVNWSDLLWGSTQHWLLYDLVTPGNYSNLGNLSINTVNWSDGFGSDFNMALPGAYFDIVDLSGDIYLRYNAIPEPSRALLAGLGLIGLLLRRRRA